MNDYYLGAKNVMIPFTAENDENAIEIAKTLIKGNDYSIFKLLNDNTGRIFDMNGTNIVPALY